jgi:hypothetical protein
MQGDDKWSDSGLEAQLPTSNVAQRGLPLTSWNPKWKMRKCDPQAMVEKIGKKRPK